MDPDDRFLVIPVLIVHATNDRLVPIAAVRTMFQRIPGRKLMLETSGGHNRAGFAPGTDLQEAMRRFWPATSNSSDASNADHEPQRHEDTKGVITISP